MVDWARCLVFESDSEETHGASVFRNMWLPISLGFKSLARGATIQDIIEWCGGVTNEQIEKVISFVSDSLDESARRIDMRGDSMRKKRGNREP